MPDLPPLIPDDGDDLNTTQSPLAPEEWAMDSLLTVSCRLADADIDARVAAVMARIHQVEAGRCRLRTVRLLVAAMVATVILGAGIFYQVHSRLAPKVAETRPVEIEAGEPGVTRVRLLSTETRSIPLSDIGSMLVQGPADLDLVGTSRVRLHRGRIRVRITEKGGQGFVVETPRAQVTDKGTEFGIDVAGDSVTGVVVFDGSVDLAVPTGAEPSPPSVEHLVQGEGVVVRRTGRLDRLMAIVVSDTGMFAPPGESRSDGSTPLIADVWDNVNVSDSKKLYEIVPGGFKEDVRCYVDRPTHEWNGIDERGLPAYLVGADYVKTFNNYKFLRGVKLHVMLSRPARLFVFLDRRVTPPGWLRESFRETGDSIGMDEGPFTYRFHGIQQSKTESGVGPGKSIDGRFYVWECVVEKAGVVTLGENSGRSRETGMYGIAAVALDKKAP